MERARGSRVAMVWLVVAVGGVVTPVGGAPPASAYDLGRKTFPVTRAVEDPFVADELVFPSVLHLKRPERRGRPAAPETSVAGEFSKLLTPRLGLSLGSAVIHHDPDGESSQTGFDNLDLSLKYEFGRSEAHEAIFSGSLGWEVGGTGKKAVGAPSFDVVKPTLFFGKGFGDLPEALSYVRPLALSGLLGAEVPTRTSSRLVRDGVLKVDRHPNVLRWGLVVQYNLPYLQSFVKDLGLRGPFAKMIPVVETELTTALDRGAGGRTTGTVNPGIMWVGDIVQVGLEAVIPINDRSGESVGVRALVVIFFEDLFPESLGRPVFGR